MPDEAYASYVADLFRTVRFGTGEAHSRAEMMEFNYLLEQKAITRDAAGKFVIDYARTATAIATLSKELLEMEATGDRARVETWFAKYGAMPSEVKAALSTVAAAIADTPWSIAWVIMWKIGPEWAAQQAK